jgi:hypothetical protein
MLYLGLKSGTFRFFRSNLPVAGWRRRWYRHSRFALPVVVTGPGRAEPGHDERKPWWFYLNALRSKSK